MKKIAMTMAVVLTFGIVNANAQGFLGKLKQKAKKAVLEKTGVGEKVLGQSASDGMVMENAFSKEQAGEETSDQPVIAVAQGSDIVPKRKTPTIVWDGTVKPSSASTAEALMNELPPLPSAEKMARSTMEERDAYTLKIAAVVARAVQLQEQATGCSDAEIEAERQKWENKVQELFGLTKQEMAILNDENASEALKEPIRQKLLTKILGVTPDMAEMQRFEKMSEKEQEAYIAAHPEFVQKMMTMGQNAANFSNNVNKMTGGINSYETQIGQLVQKYSKTVMQEESHSYASIAQKYEAKLQQYYSQICASNDAASIDALYAEADKMLYNYRLEAAKEYRASLQRLIEEQKQFAAEYIRLTKEVIARGDLPECALARADLNAVIVVANVLDEAYKELPKLEAIPVCTETIYELQNGWSFGSWECQGYIGDVTDFKTPGSQWPLLAYNESNEYAVVENGKFRKITENELNDINKRADQRAKKRANSDKTPPYGTFKSRSEKRVVEYSKTGEVIIDGMTSFTPVAFTSKANQLEWIVIDDNKILKCTYKL